MRSPPATAAPARCSPPTTPGVPGHRYYRQSAHRRLPQLWPPPCAPPTSRTPSAPNGRGADARPHLHGQSAGLCGLGGQCGAAARPGLAHAHHRTGRRADHRPGYRQALPPITDVRVCGAGDHRMRPTGRPGVATPAALDRAWLRPFLRHAALYLHTGRIPPTTSAMVGSHGS